MNRLLLFLVIVFSSFSVHAQSQNSQEEMQALVQKVDSLEHELSFLKQTYELNSLNSDISMFTNEINTKTIEIQLYIYNKNFDIQLYDSYQKNYESYKIKEQSFSDLIEVKKKLFMLNIITHSYSENEKEMLMSSYNLIDDNYNMLKKYNDFLKLLIETYKKYL